MQGSKRHDVLRDQVTSSGITVWTDGSVYFTHPVRPGGWGFVIADRGTEVARGSGPELMTTANRMELTAIIRALEALHRLVGRSPAYLYSDSQHAIRGITEWMRYWRLAGWQKSTGGEVKNRDLWEQIYQATFVVNVTFRWVRGHRGVAFNELADKLAGHESKGAMEAWRTSRLATSLASPNVGQ